MMLRYILRKQFLREWERTSCEEDFPDYFVTIDKLRLLVARCIKKIDGKVFYHYKLFVSDQGFAIGIFRGRIIKILYWFVHRTSTGERFQRATRKF